MIFVRSKFGPFYLLHKHSDLSFLLFRRVEKKVFDKFIF